MSPINFPKKIIKFSYLESKGEPYVKTLPLADNMLLPRILIGWPRCFSPLWTVRLITLVVIFRHPIQNHSKVAPFADFNWFSQLSHFILLFLTILQYIIMKQRGDFGHQPLSVEENCSCPSLFLSGFQSSLMHKKLIWLLQYTTHLQLNFIHCIKTDEHCRFLCCCCCCCFFYLRLWMRSKWLCLLVQKYLFIFAASAISFTPLHLKVLLIFFSTFLLQVAMCLNWLMLSFLFKIELFLIYSLFRSSQTTFTHEVDDYYFFHPADWVHCASSKDESCQWVLCAVQRLQWSKWCPWMDWNLYSALQ